jgi:dinuclear metal center YbgI/SA1388 family protein
VKRQALQSLLNDYLRVSTIKDYCPNGLQVEGKDNILRIVTGVTASEALIDAAIEGNADAILVHHGYFWKGESSTVTGMKKRRLAKLLAHDINLFAYHLPLDLHPEVGNNRQLGEVFNFAHLQPIEGIAPQGIVYQGTTSTPLSFAQLCKHIAYRLGRKPLCEGNQDTQVQNIAWCTGGGQSFIEQVADLDVDVFITGEVSEPTIHVAREMGIHFISAGHHATERYGIKALGEYLHSNYDLEVQFIDINNPA